MVLGLFTVLGMTEHLGSVLIYVKAEITMSVIL